MTPTGAVVIGGGPNRLVVANLLADAGWDVVLLEAQDQVGGAVRGDSGCRDSFVRRRSAHSTPRGGLADDPATWARALHGLAWSHAPAVAGTPFADGR